MYWSSLKWLKYGSGYLFADFDKPFELPLEQASRLLEDQDFENFPDDAFNDIFCKRCL